MVRAHVSILCRLRVVCVSVFVEFRMLFCFLLLFFLACYITCRQIADMLRAKMFRVCPFSLSFSFARLSSLEKATLT